MYICLHVRKTNKRKHFNAKKLHMIETGTTWCFYFVKYTSWNCHYVEYLEYVAPFACLIWIFLSWEKQNKKVWKILVKVIKRQPFVPQKITGLKNSEIPKEKAYGLLLMMKVLANSQYFHHYNNFELNGI